MTPSGPSTRLRLPPELESGPAARSALRRLLDAAGVGTDVRDTTLLLATELLTNAAEHGGGSSVLDATIDSEVVRLEVTDRNPALPGPATLPAEHDERGRGLMLIAALSSRWGAERRERGKIVWCEIALT